MAMIKYFSKLVGNEGTLFAHLCSPSLHPDCLQRIVHQLCEPLKTHSHCLASKAEKLKAAHGLQLFVKLLTEEVATQQTRGGKGLPESLLKQLPYITWYLTMTLSKVMSKDIRARGGLHSLGKEESIGDLLVFSLMATQSIQKLVEMVCVTMRNGQISTAIVKSILVPLTNNLLECIQVWPLTHFFCILFVKNH